MWYCVAVCCGVLQCVAVCCSVLPCVCSVLQRVAACCSVLQSVAVCCSTDLLIMCGEWLLAKPPPTCVLQDEYRMLQCVAVCCSVLQCVAVCCSVLQCVAVQICSSSAASGSSHLPPRICVAGVAVCGKVFAGV